MQLFPVTQPFTTLRAEAPSALKTVLVKLHSSWESETTVEIVDFHIHVWVYIIFHVDVKTFWTGLGTCSVFCQVHTGA